MYLLNQLEAGEQEWRLNMIIFVLFIIGLAIFEIINIKEKSINIILPYLLLAVITTALGIFYFSDITRPSFAFNLLNLLRIEY